MSELKTCPFCGGEADKLTSSDGFTSIGCLRCNPVFGVMVQAPTEAQAAAAWNTRHVETCRLPETRIDHGSIEYNGTTSWRLCSACGAEVLADPANYCPNCGREVER